MSYSANKMSMFQNLGSNKLGNHSAINGSVKIKLSKLQGQSKSANNIEK